MSRKIASATLTSLCLVLSACGGGGDGGSGTRQVAPVGAYEIAERGEHLQFFGEGLDPFNMPRKHALQHHKVGHLEIEDWES